MKTKSLTPWCNLYLSESKYKIAIKHSRDKNFFYRVLPCYLLISAFIISVSFNFYLLASFTLVAYFILSVVRSKNIIISNSLVNEDKPLFVLTTQGECQFTDQQGRVEERTLSPYSRVSFLGCWLFFSQQEGDNRHSSTFIFKDSLSSKDYSRLRRVILALK